MREYEKFISLDGTSFACVIVHLVGKVVPDFFVDTKLIIRTVISNIWPTSLGRRMFLKSRTGHHLILNLLENKCRWYCFILMRNFSILFLADKVCPALYTEIEHAGDRP